MYPGVELTLSKDEFLFPGWYNLCPMIERGEIRQQIEGFTQELDPRISRFIHKAATDMVDLGVKAEEEDRVLIVFDKPGITGLSPLPLVRELHIRCLEKGATTNFYQQDLVAEAEQVRNLEIPKIQGVQKELESLVNDATAVIIIYCPEDPTAVNSIPEDKRVVYRQRAKQVRRRTVEGDVRWTLFYLPTVHDVENEGRANPNMTYDKYLNTVMSACEQPWEEIRAAQALLAQKLDVAERIRFIANQTDIQMSLKGMIFAESVVDVNYPGSEVFSAPRLYSAKGKLFAPGWHTYFGRWMRDINLVVRRGKIVTATAVEGQGFLDEILDPEKYGVGVRYFGELGFGTNPGLRERLVHHFWAEKAAGSFHLAVGNCYEHKEWNGKPVNVNNGNTTKRTIIHWDIPRSMLEKGSLVIVTYANSTEETIQENGFFTDPRLSVLNPISSKII